MFRIAAGLLLAVLLSVVGYQDVRQLNSHGPEGLLQRADDMSWLNSWIEAEPLYRQAEHTLCCFGWSRRAPSSPNGVRRRTIAGRVFTV